ncbi:MAG: hypothetical protein DKT66_25530 [Candidatus Melainabacteria bacterium]|nr:MAG: hypothetical protein DKT66_25530 [Candidatus Melainabacteria bacterium]
MHKSFSIKVLLTATAAIAIISTGAFAADGSQGGNSDRRNTPVAKADAAIDVAVDSAVNAAANAANQEYNLTVGQLEKLYKQSTDGLPASTVGTFNPAALYSQGPMIPLGSLNLSQSMQQLLTGGVPTQGLPLTDTSLKMQLLQLQQQLLSQISDPLRNIPSALASQLAVQTMLGNSFAQITTANANAAINFTGKYLINFTAQEGNIWNKLRNNIFVPIAILLLVPGAVLTQTKVMMSAGNPVIEAGNPFEGILRAVVAMCFIPGSFLVINYGIDFSNSISHTIQEFYKAQFGTDMYADAFKGQQRAFPSRQAAENKNTLSILPGLAPMSPFPKGNDVTGLSGLENQLFNNKTFGADGTQQAIEGMADELMPSSEVVARLAVFGSNMAVTTIWDLLCTFQLIYLHYLFLVGPIMAAIWVYPVRQLREAWPNWVVGVITLCFWSLFWNTAVLLMALFNNADATGTFIFTALNCLATGSVKFAFDFVGLITEAGHTAVSAARNHMAQNNQNPLMMPTQNNLNGLGALTNSALGKVGENGLGGITSGATGANGTTGIGSLASTASTLAAEGLGSANAALSSTASSLANQLLGNLGSVSNGMQSATSAMKDWTNGLDMPPLAQGAVNSLNGTQIAAIGQEVAGMAQFASGTSSLMSLPPLAASANTMLDAAQTMMPALSGQAGMASTELGKLASAVEDSKGFASLVGNPVAAIEKGAQAINMDPSTYGNVPVPGAANISSGVNGASQFVANALDNASVSSALNSGLSAMNGTNGAEAQFANSLLNKMNNAVSGANLNFDASSFTGGGALNAALNLNPTAVNSAITAAQANFATSAQAQVAAQVTQQMSAQSIAQFVDAPFAQAPAAQNMQSAQQVQTSAAPSVQAYAAPATYAQPVAPAPSPVVSAPAPVVSAPAPVAVAVAAAPAPVVSSPAAVVSAPAPQSGSGVMAAFQAAEATRKMEAEAKVAAPAAPKNSGVDFLKAVTEERARQAAQNPNANNNGYPSWAKPI